MKAINLVVTVDTECDKGPGWMIQSPLSFDSVTKGIPETLMPLFRKHQIVPTFLLSPEVMNDEESVEVLQRISDCELGTHLHGEYIQPDAEFNAPRTKTPQSAYNSAVELKKLVNLTELFKKRFGRQPLSFRAGRFALSPHTLDFLNQLQYKVDTSVTPFKSNQYGNGYSSNYWGAPIYPYHPSSKDPRKKGKLPLLEVPVTILNSAFARWPAFLLRRISDDSRWHKKVSRVFGLSPKRFWLRPLRATPEELLSGAETVISQWNNRNPVVLNIMFHSVEIIPGASPYAQTSQDVEYLLQSLENLFVGLRSHYQIRSTGLSEIYDVPQN